MSRSSTRTAGRRSAARDASSRRLRGDDGRHDQVRDHGEARATCATAASTAWYDPARVLASASSAKATRASLSSRTTPTTSCPATLAATLSRLVAAYRGAGRPRRVEARRSTSSRCTPTCRTSGTCCPGSIVMSIFMTVMIGGGIIYIDDKARGLHEGYLVTPITQARADRRLQPVRHDQGRDVGHACSMIVGALIAGCSESRSSRCACCGCSCVIVVTVVRLISMMFLLMVRMNRPAAAARDRSAS